MKQETRFAGLRSPKGGSIMADDETIDRHNSLAIDDILAQILEAREEDDDDRLQTIIERHPEFKEQIYDFLRNEDFAVGVLEDVQNSSGPPSFGEDYQIIELIDEGGGQGVVYKVLQKSMNRVVAVKTPQKRFATPAGSESIRAEAQRAARLRH